MQNKKNTTRISTFLLLIISIFFGLDSQSSPAGSDVTQTEGDFFLEIPDRPKGEFVKDVPIPELEVRFPKIQKDALGNRGEILSLSQAFFPITDMELHFYVGDVPKTKPEVPDLLFETWKLGGTKSLPGGEFMERLEYLGAKLDWIGSFEKSVLRVSFLKRDEREIFSILNDWLVAPIWDEKNFQIAKRQYREALLRRNDSVAKLGIRKTKERVYRGHLRGRSSSLKTLEEVRLEDLKKYHKLILGASKVNATLSGDTKPKDLITLMDSVFQKNKAYRLLGESSLSTADINYKDWAKKFRNSPREIHIVEKETNQSIVILTGAMPPHNHPDFYAIQTLNYILGGGGFNSYLMTEIRNNRGLAYSTTSHVSFLETHGLFLSYSLTKNESVPEVLELMHSILSSATANKIRQDELERAQNAIVNQFVFLFENKKNILSNQIRFQDHKMGEGYLESFRKKIQSVTLEDIRRVGKKYFQPDHFRTTIVGPASLEKRLKRRYPSIKIIQPEDK